MAHEADLFHNPFHVLGASALDDKKRLTELAEEKSLTRDPSACSEALAILANPRKRLAAEIAWFPGAGGAEAAEALARIKNGDLPDVHGSEPHPLGAANAAAALIAAMRNGERKSLSLHAAFLIRSFDAVHCGELEEALNAARKVAGIPRIVNSRDVASELGKRKQYFSDVVLEALDGLAPSDIIACLNVLLRHFAIKSGSCPAVLACVMTGYEERVRLILEEGENRIKGLCADIENGFGAAKPASALKVELEILLGYVKKWLVVASPLLLYAKIVGLPHRQGIRVADAVRNLGLRLLNEYGRLDAARLLVAFLKSGFRNARQTAERACEDEKALDELYGMVERRLEERKEAQEAWAREISYETDIGLFFKKRFKISPDGVFWAGSSWNLDSISWLRWGGISKYVNGLPAGTEYRIGFGHGRRSAVVSLRRFEQFAKITECLWKAVGARLLTEYLQGLARGETYRFGGLVLKDDGVELAKAHLFSADERIFCRWKDVALWNEPGKLYIGKRGDKKLHAAFSYLDDDNVHILEAALRMLFKSGKATLSGLLE